MESKGLDKWLQRDVRVTKELELPEAGITVTLQALDWKTVQNLRKKNTHFGKDGSEIRNDDGFPMDLIATGIKEINGQPFNFYKADSLELLGEKNHSDAINNRFTVPEISLLIVSINGLSKSSSEAEKAEVDELKN